MARLLAEDIVEGEVGDLAGECYERKSSGNGLRRWGSNDGSTPIDGEQVPIEEPRVRNVKTGKERPLQSYQAMKESTGGKETTDAILMASRRAITSELSGRGPQIPVVDGFDLSQSSVSRRLQERVRKPLKEFEERPVEEENLLAVWIDEKRVVRGVNDVCLGVTEEGYKKVIGFT